MDPDPGLIPRPTRVIFPVKVSFSSQKFDIHEFTANLSIGGIFLCTDEVIPPGTRGTLTFRISRWEEPFTVAAEVARVVEPGEDTREPAGLGIKFIELTARDAGRLKRLVEGIRDGSIAEAIRRTVREEGINLLQELRRRPADQKVTFAFCAKGEEIDVLVRDGNMAVLMRLLDNPRLTTINIKKMLRDPRVPTKVLDAINQAKRWLVDDEARFLFCSHPNAPLATATLLLTRLRREHLMALERNANLRTPIRMKAREALRALR
ncbi:MAG: PilZ domain-containing protein [Acidobacteriota bacterium]